MAKAVLVIDTDDCAGCPAAIYDEIDGISFCQASHCRDIPDYFNKPNWCPLIPEPERREHGEAVGYTEGKPLTEEIVERLIDFGFNECLDEIEIATEGKA